MPFIYNHDYFLTSNPNIDDNKELREPQLNAYYEIMEHFIIKKKQSHAILVLPTGVGKTGLMGILPFGICKGRVLIITPQLTIKDTVIDSLDPEYHDNFWIKRKVLNSPGLLPSLVEYEGSVTKKEVLDSANIVVMNIQKLQKRLESSPLNFLPEDYFDMILIDEAHHSTAKTWIDTIFHFSKAKVVKLTGTPFRTDNEKISGELVYKYPLSRAMANEYVKSLENLTYIPGELHLTIDEDLTRTYTVEEIYELELKDEEWVSRSVAYSRECSEKVVNESIKLLENKLSNNNSIPHKIIAVACSIKHAEEIAELYEMKGFKTALVHSKLETNLKESVMKDIENNRVQVVVNVSMLGEGFDHPYLSIAAIFRPFRHSLPYAQFIGRILRVIPKIGDIKTDDNIGQIVSHEHLGLKELWDYYKQEIQESEIIKALKEFDDEYDLDEDEDVDSDSSGTKLQDRSIGKATERGHGILVGETYLDTELIKKRKAEQKIREDKIKQLQELLKVNREQAEQIYDQAEAESKGSDIKRPDKYFARKKKNIDERIREEIVPHLIAKFKINQHQDNLKNSALFRGRFSWIANKRINNGGMLAIYFNTYLKEEIGSNRESWSISDYEIALEKIDGIVEYVEKVLEEFINI